MFDFAAYLGKEATMERLKAGIKTAETVKEKNS